MHINLVSINTLLYSVLGSFEDEKDLQTKDFLILIIWRLRDISSWAGYRETKTWILKATKSIKKLITNIPFSYTQTMSTRTTHWASSTYIFWWTLHWLDLLSANTGQKFSISSLKILMSSNPFLQVMKIFVTGFLQTK